MLEKTILENAILENTTKAITAAINTRALLLALGLFAIAGCGDESSAKPASTQSAEKTDGEHFLSDEQKALERSKAAAESMAEAAAERARQTEDARN